MKEFLRNSKAHIFPEKLDDTIEVTGEDFHHLSRVLRLKQGEYISAGHLGSVREYILSEVLTDKLVLVSTSDIEKIDEKEIILAVGLFKIDRLEWAIQKAVETGVTSFIIGQSEYSSIKLNEKQKEKLINRLEKIICNASMQSRRSSLPSIIYTKDLIEYLDKNFDSLIICDPDGKEKLDQGGVVMVGPEGGWSQSELDKLNTKSMRWKISQNILRAETACVVASSLYSRLSLV